MEGEEERPKQKRSNRDYFEYSKKPQTNRNKIYPNVEVNNKNLNKCIVTLDNSRQLHFFKPQREAEGWVSRNERFAEKKRNKRRIDIISNKRQVASQNIQLKICFQNVRGLNQKLKQYAMMKEFEDRNPDFIALVETRLQRIIGLNSQNITQTQLARNGRELTMNSGKYKMKTIKTLFNT
ncbi:hypothetical protein OXYTRIMIC_633 [Oxytricha trifallax]|uniref:Uncharacterized protein n=1 Tax=Oxytricha trifallax TaxID=1172189 RepID=A0A073HZ77_9SPIT|nr:hypothetical protein OXYTRIMIC_633 [Oxytricha trifallax]